MPRSVDGRWIRQCAICGKDYHQLRPQQITCSIACRAKLPHNTGGIRYKAGLEPRTCETCGAEFRPLRSKQRWCTPQCYRQSQHYRDQLAETNRKRRLAHAADPSKRRADNFKQNIRKYGLTVAEFEAKLAAQGGRCMICAKPPKLNGIRAASRLHVDHDHATGAVRDLICTNCNQGLGYFKDDPVLMRAAAEYIERHRVQT